MANEINFVGDAVSDAGKTITFTILRASDGVALGTPNAAMVETTPGMYTADVPASITTAQELLIRFFDDGEQFAAASLLWDGTKEVDALTNEQLGVNNHTANLAQHTATQAAVGALPDAAAINAEVDTALADYDAPTAAELAATQTALEADHAATLAAVNGLNDLSPAEVNAELDTALADYDPSNRLEDIADRDQILAAIAAQVPAPTAAAVADAVWDEARADHVVPGSMGETQPDQDLSALATSAQVAGLPTPLTAAEINAEVDTALLDYDAPTQAELAAAQAAIQADIAGIPAGATPAQIAGAVWDEPIGDHTVAGSAGESQPDQDLSALATSAEITALENISSAQVQTAAAAALSSYGAATASNVAASQAAVQLDISNLTIPTAVAVAAAVWSETTRSLTDPVTLTAAALTNVADAVQAAIINEGDGQQVVDAIVQAINSGLDVSATELAAIAAAVRTELAAELANLDAAVSTRSTLDAVDAQDAAELALAAYDAATDADVVSAISGVPTSADIADAVWNEDMASHSGAGTFGERLNDLQAQVVAALTSHGVATETAVLATQALISGLNNLSSADVTAAVPSPTAVAVRVWNASIASNSDPGSTGEALESAAAGGGATPAAIAAEVWDTLAANHTAAGTMGASQPDQDLSALATSAEIAALEDITPAQVRSEVDAALVAADVPSATGLNAGVTMILSAIAAAAAPTANDVADAVWDEPRNEHVVVGSMGETQPFQDLSSFSAGLTQVMNDIAALNNLSAAEVNAEMDTALADYDAPTKAELDAAETTISALINGLNNLTIADVETGLSNYDTATEADVTAAVTSISTLLTTLAADNSTIATILKVLINKRITDPVTSRDTIYDDDGVTPLVEADLYEDATGTIGYRGQGAERRDPII